ncbi:MAG: hypothetical protein HYY76_06620 [Acidobacteria bacterium]|nr:hypothetical protein [Acidobacteriota bacterium]
MKVLLTALSLIVLIALVAGPGPAEAQWLDRHTPGVPRTLDGKPNLTAPAPRGPDGKPDLTGIWNGPAPATSRPDPADLQAWVNDLARQRQLEYHRTRPYYQCLPSGPEAERFGGWKRILQTPAAIAILNDDLTYRVIHTDGRELEADPAPSWMGYSVGRWEGNTLVVESTGFNDKTWTSRYGVSHSEKLRITERYRRTDFGHLQVEVTYTDPGAYVKPWGFTVNLALAADTEMLEAVCERTSEQWAGSLSDAASQAVSVPPEVLARYVGVYSGIYGGRKRTVEVSLSGGQLIARIVGASVDGGLGAAGLDEGAARPLVPQSQTLFEGLGLGYQFIVDDKGVATDIVEIHVSGNYRFTRQR